MYSSLSSKSMLLMQLMLPQKWLPQITFGVTHLKNQIRQKLADVIQLNTVSYCGWVGRTSEGQTLYSSYWQYLVWCSVRLLTFYHIFPANFALIQVTVHNEDWLILQASGFLSWTISTKNCVKIITLSNYTIVHEFLCSFGNQIKYCQNVSFI